MNIALEIDTHDKALQFDLFGTRELEPNKTSTGLPGGVCRYVATPRGSAATEEVRC